MRNYQLNCVIFACVVVFNKRNNGQDSQNQKKLSGFQKYKKVRKVWEVFVA
jgi:hypothetical protein